jgi:peptide/nickel transport system permease protein
LAYVARRLLISVPVLLGILVVSFVFLQMLPGDPVRAMLKPEQLAGASPEYLAQRRAELGLDGPVPVQFVAWIRQLLQGNLGYSFHKSVPVTHLIGERIWPTVILAFTGMGIALLVGVSIGVLAALRQNSLFDYVSATGSIIAVSIPGFFLGLIAIYVFALWLGILPSGGIRTLGADPTFGDSLGHLVLPVGVLSSTLVGPYVRFTRQSMLEVLHQDHITTARAKGVPRRGVIIGHGLRNALIPLTTILCLQIPGLLSGVLIIEQLFSWPGLGRLGFQAVMSRDYPVVMAFVLLGSTLVMIFNLLADLLAAVLDPRIRL